MSPLQLKGWLQRLSRKCFPCAPEESSPLRSSSDAIHGTDAFARLKLTQAMILRFVQDRILDDLQQVLVLFPLTQGSFDVGFLIREKATPHASVRRQTKPIAFLAEMVAQCSDQSDLPKGAFKSISLSRAVEGSGIYRPQDAQGSYRVDDFPDGEKPL